MKCNAFLQGPTKSKSKSKPLGIFDQFDPSLQEAIITVATTDAPATLNRNNDDIERQAKARRIKEELIKEKGLEKVTEEYKSILMHSITISCIFWWRVGRLILRLLLLN